MKLVLRFDFVTHNFLRKQGSLRKCLNRTPKRRTKQYEAKILRRQVNYVIENLI